VYRLIPSSSRNYKRLVAVADTAQQVGLIHQILGDNMNDAIRRLHPASAREHLRLAGSFRGPSPRLGATQTKPTANPYVNFSDLP
jgi:hypothetical protein